MTLRPTTALKSIDDCCRGGDRAAKAAPLLANEISLADVDRELASYRTLCPPRQDRQGGRGFRSLGDPLWDTTSPQGRLLRTILAGVAKFERDVIRERTSEGRRRAMANGVKFGRKLTLSAFQRAEAIKRRDAGETLAAIAKSYAVNVSTISRL